MSEGKGLKENKIPASTEQNKERKDIFIDNNIAKNFTNPADPSYKELIRWLLKKNEDTTKNSFLVVSNKLLKEYKSSSRDCFKGTNIHIIIDFLTRNARLIHVSNQQIKDFEATYITSSVARRLLSNAEDRSHIPIILLSDRKMALTLDKDFAGDIMKIPGFNPVVAHRPDDLDYL